MKILHLIGGGDVGGAKNHVLSLVKELGKHINVKLVSLRPGAFSDDAREMGIDVEVISTGNIVRDIKRVIAIVKDGGYDILHAHGAKANFFSILVKHFLKLPVITTIHSDYRLDYLHSIYKMFSFGLINIISLRFIDNYICVSRDLRNNLIKRKFDPEKILIINNSLNFSQPLRNYSRTDFSKKYNLGLKDTDIIIGILARLTPIKGLNIFLQAARLVLKQNPSVKFLIGGDGEERKSLERKAASMGITDSVHFLGWVNDPYEFMGNLDINLLTSISEGFPIVILEGALLRRATVSSDVGGISDLIESGENGYLFNPGDYKKLAEYILELAKNKSRRDEFGERIHTKARRHFSLENMCKSQLDIYEAVLKSYKAPSKITKAREKQPYDAIISGWYGFRNIGDDAILKAVISDLGMYKKDIRLMVLSWNPSETKKIYGVDSINRFNILKILWTMKDAKLFIYGGGTLIQESTSTRSLMYYLGIIWIAKKMGLKVMLYANGIEPINKYINRKLTQKIVNQVEVITLRERLSLQELEKLHVDKPRILITADAALTIKAENDDEINRLLANEGIDSEGPFVGFSVRTWSNHEKYEVIIAGIADYFVEKYRAIPVFIPMQYPGDLRITESILAGMRNKGYIIKNKYSESHVLGIIKKMDMLIGMRLHSIIFAASVGVPVVGLAYETKVDGFLQYIGQKSLSAGDVKTLEYNSLKKLVDYVWDNKSEIKIQLNETIGDLKQKAHENARIAVELIQHKR